MAKLNKRYWFVPAIMLLAQPFLSPAAGEDKYEVRSIMNSKTFSQVIAINANLDIIGTREVDEGPIRSTRSFFRSGASQHSDRGEIEIEAPPSFTNIELQSLSDNGLVVGYISRPAGNAKGSLFGFVWDSQSKELTQLPVLPKHGVCHAQDISSDGTIITGYCTGNEPPGIRPCIWTRENGQKEWTVTELESLFPHNPFLQASQIIISPNGKRIAGCITVQQASQFEYISALHVWERNDGKWTRKKICDGAFKLKDMNDQGLIVGEASGGVNRPFAVNLMGELTIIDLLPGDESGAAYGVFDDGTVVGISDDPHGGEGGPTAFMWKSGVVSPIRLRAGTIYSAALAANRNGAIGGYMIQGENEDAPTHAYVRIPIKK